MKKAQIETMGLVIIVALLAFILVFVLQILAKPSPSNLNTRYLQLNADNLRSSILKTTICENVNIKDEILNCNDFNDVQCDNLQDCNALKNVIKTIIEDSLNVTRSYEFKAGNVLLKEGTCTNVYAAASEPIPYSEINVMLSIC